MKILSLQMTAFKNKPKTSGRLPVLLAVLLGVLMLSPMAAAQDTASDTCLNHTGSESACKDCCDCLESAGNRKTCRDACMAKASTQDGFALDTDLISVDVVSELGPDDDYSQAVAMGGEQDCKTWCDESDSLACGDRRYCRDACNAAFADANDNPSQTAPDGGDNISITQATSDEAQMKTIAFSALAFLTGDLCSYTFFPPGKVSDFFGFQYMRDTTPNGFGHNTEFAGRIADNVLSILTDAQVWALVDLANTQADQVDAFGYKRFVLIRAFKRLLDKDLPDGAAGLDKAALMDFTADLYEMDGEISYDRARVLGDIVTQLTDDQKTRLAQLQEALTALFLEAGEGGSIAEEDWPAADPADLSGLLSQNEKVLVSTYATQLFSWYPGSVEGDTYFCPERHGTYFGSFYLKDIPPLTATQALTIDTNLTAEMGSDFLETIGDSRASLITDLAEIQKSDLSGIVSIRQKIAGQLRLFMTGASANKAQVLADLRQYGQYEGEMMFYYATRFAAVANSLSDEQMDMVMGIRLEYYRRFPDYQADSTIYDCKGAWLFSEHLEQMPEIENTDFLFDASGGEPAILDVQVNGSPGPVTLSPEDPLVVSIGLEANALEGQTADWWMLRFHEEGNQWDSFILKTGWVSGFFPAVRGPLASFSAYPVFSGNLPAGTHVFCFGYDLNSNGNPDEDSLQYDCARALVTP